MSMPGKVTSTEEEDENRQLPVKLDKVCSEDVEMKVSVKVVPDGGWGWFVVLGSFIIMVVMGGIHRSGGVLFLLLIDRYGMSAAATSWVPTLPSAVNLMCGPICSMLSQRYTCRTVVMGGTIIYSASLIISAYSPSLEFLYFSYGILGGIGRSFCYGPSIMMVGLYFKKRLGIATGLSTCGAGVGTFALPPLVEMVFKYYGFQGGFYILAGVALHVAVSSMLFRPLSLQTRLIAFDKRKKEQLLTEEKSVCLNEKRTFTSSDSLNFSSQTFYITTEDKKQHDKSSEQSSSEALQIVSAKDKQAECNENKLNTVQKYTKKKLFHIPCFYDNSDKVKAKKKHLELSLLKDYRFCSFCVALFLFTMAFQSAFVFLPAYGRQLGNDDQRATYLLVIAGVFDGIGRIFAGTILDLKRVKRFRVYIYNIIMFTIALVSIVIPHTRTYLHLCIISGVYGLLTGIYISQKSIILIDLLGAEKLINSFGILSWFQGVGILIGPPFSGFLRDINGKYEIAFYVGGACILLGAFIFLVSNMRHIITNRRKKGIIQTNGVPGGSSSP